MSKFRHADDPSTRIRSFAVTFHSGDRSTLHRLAPPHSEDWHQLIYATRGVVRVETSRQTWIVPPHRAVWIPAGLETSLRMHGEVALRMLYVRTGPRALPRECTVVNVPSLLREMIVRTALIGALDFRTPRQARLGAVLLDELRNLQAISLQLPLPLEPRAARFVELIAATPRLAPPLDLYFRKSGASRRTLERLFRQETSLSLGHWIRRHLILHALGLLGTGQPVSAVAATLGYSSPSAFISMFRKELGQTPARYFSSTATGPSV